jgi:2-keto-4-pentenoate hydratase
MSSPFIDPPSFRRFKQGAARLHEARKIGEARRAILGSRINDRELTDAVTLIDAWLKRQPADVREYALAKPEPRKVATMREP